MEETVLSIFFFTAHHQHLCLFLNKFNGGETLILILQR